MSLDIATARSRRDVRHFVALPWALYDRTRYPQWIPPLRLMVHENLDRKKNPFYRNADRELFLAVRDGRIVGRIAAIENRAHNAYHGDRVGFFGFFEAADDPEATGALVDAAAEWLRARGLETLRGPMSPSTNHECGLLVDGFEHEPTLLTPWNPRYYERLLAGAGLRAVKDLLGYHIPMEDARFALPERYAAHAERAKARQNLSFRGLDLKRFAQEIDVCWYVYNAAWEDNWGFVPMTHEEFTYMANEMKALIVPDLAFFAEVEGRAAGFVLALPDFNQIFKRIPSGRLLPTGIFKLLTGKSKVRGGRVILLGVRPEFRSRGLYQLFAHELFQRGRKLGYTAGEASWILEDNLLMTRPLEAIGAVPYRRWRVYERATA